MSSFGHNDITIELFGDTGDSFVDHIIDMDRSGRAKKAVDQLYRDLSPWTDRTIRYGVEKSQDGAGWAAVIEPRTEAGKVFLQLNTLSSLARRAMGAANLDDTGAPSSPVRFAYVGVPLFSNKGIIHFRTSRLSWLDSMNMTELVWER